MAQLENEDVLKETTILYDGDLPACPAAFPQPTNIPLLFVTDQASGRQIGCAVTKTKMLNV